MVHFRDQKSVGEDQDIGFEGMGALIEGGTIDEWHL